MLAMLAAHAGSDSRFLAAGELRVKESDRLEGIARGTRDLGGHAATEGNDLVVAGGGLEGGRADARGDHRMAMASACPRPELAAPSRGRRHGERGGVVPGIHADARHAGRGDRAGGWPMTTPRVVAIDGAAGSGKSTLSGAREVALSGRT